MKLFLQGVKFAFILTIILLAKWCMKYWLNSDPDTVPFDAMLIYFLSIYMVASYVQEVYSNNYSWWAVVLVLGVILTWGYFFLSATNFIGEAHQDVLYDPGLELSDMPETLVNDISKIVLYFFGLLAISLGGILWVFKPKATAG